MNLQTQIKLPNYPFSISHQDGIVSVGSCFSENIGEKLLKAKFDCLVNSHGILFNPISVAKALDDCIENKSYREEDLSSNKEIQFSFNHHSSFSSLDKAEVVQNINKTIAAGHQKLKKANVVILTFGTAWVYRLLETKQVVANCYKLPHSNFKKELLTINEIVVEVSEAIEKLRSMNSEVNIITTISPVRHWKDGVVENQQSKSTLHLALKEINERFAFSHYFPSYEIMMDELRDYRFYATDMLHPSELAIDYIWKKFSDSFFTKETQELNKRILQIEKEKNHKPFNSESAEFAAFSKQLIKKENQLYNDFPYLKRD